MGQLDRFIERSAEPPRVVGWLFAAALAVGTTGAAIANPGLVTIVRAAVFVLFAGLWSSPFARDGRLDAWLRSRTPLDHVFAVVFIAATGFAALTFFLSPTTSLLICIPVAFAATAVSHVLRRRRTAKSQG